MEYQREELLLLKFGYQNIFQMIHGLLFSFVRAPLLLIVVTSNGTDENDDKLPHGDPLRGMRIDFGHGLVATVYDGDKNISKLRRIRFSKSGTQLIELLYRLGQPRRYEYVSRPWDLDYYQTVYAREPGSAEMPSAGRAFTWKLLLGLRRHGVGLAYICLHAGLSSYMDDALDCSTVLLKKNTLLTTQRLNV